MTPDAATVDPRTTLARPDLAEQALEGLVRADTYRAVQPMQAAVPFADIHADADPASERIDQLIFGEAFDVLDRQGDRLWGRARRDGLVGWIAASALQPGSRLPTHRVAAVAAGLPLNALVVEAADVSPDDLAPIGAFESDPVAVAERLIGVPHSLGARSSAATDCSGLIQQALYACGLAGPRHADQQAELGRAIDRADARRGDLVVWLARPGDYSWTGHSAFMLDADQVIHATGHHGAVVIEAFAEADARCRAEGFRAPVFRRL
ncbi:NlpC/P60 family protein [Brevundimonas basaltis]|uniref:Cell wall-associated NlpC family hydrolase n=1 Tax=Brevundimonas basaltis TaxID=472166 RepID=A0A7W8I034_9CAUL|nr:NlpC/P60 family protein [Brevundimonas basaltis]MBB5292794.1 cell wall-associated NlpC family hydrolase [Brevundimonas basaltis]